MARRLADGWRIAARRTAQKGVTNGLRQCTPPQMTRRWRVGRKPIRPQIDISREVSLWGGQRPLSSSSALCGFAALQSANQFSFSSMFLGLLSGVLSALAQSTSYVFSARYLQRHHSAGWLLLYSQALMGASCLPALVFLWPGESLWRLLAWLVPLWVAFYFGGQGFFFVGQRLIESSKLVSLLGLKIPVLAMFTMLFQRAHLPLVAWGAVALTVGGAVLFNWTGGRRLTLRALGAVLGTVVLYCACDLLETHLVRVTLGSAVGLWPVLRASLFALCALYAFLGALCWGVLLRRGFHARLLWASAPFCAFWYASQVLLLMCFGAVGPVYGNVLNALRGLFSVMIGLFLSRTGWIKGEVRVSAAMWVRRAIAALLIVFGIALYSLSNG